MQNTQYLGTNKTYFSFLQGLKDTNLATAPIYKAIYIL